MCTAICYRSASSYFGRNLDLEYRYTEQIMISPRNFSFKFKHLPPLEHHYAIIGIGTQMDGYPLYYDAINEYGLGIASLNFVGNCFTSEKRPDKINLATFEIIPYILGSCKTVEEARNILIKTNLTNDRFSYKLPVAELHFMLSDKHKSLVAEPLANGFRIYENPIEVLANNPPFEFHLKNLEHYLKSGNEVNHHTDEQGNLFNAESTPFSFPGDLASPSRFLRAAAIKLASPKKVNEADAVNQFFHMLASVYHIDGALKVGNDYKRTQYSSCANLDTLTYYCKTYSNSRIFSVKLKKENFISESLISYPLLWNEDIKELN